MNGKTIEITVAPDGATRVRTQGFTGADCRDASRLLEKALGEVAGERMTSEFYLSQRLRQQQCTGGEGSSP